jgi:Ni,Fe-hydrogenase I large subunit
MSKIFNIDPVVRIEGHLKVYVEVGVSGDSDTANIGKVKDVRLESKLFRGMENILKRRDPRDAPVICQRI